MTNPSLSNGHSIREIFTQVTNHWQDRVTAVEDLTCEIRAILGKHLTEAQHHKMLEGFYSLKEAFTFLQEQAAHPELTLATTGTTSSGKSTLANFLIGESILPSAVQEMSAGLVRVKHNNNRSLVIKRIDKTTKEEKIIHTQENPTAKDINDHLESQMNAFRVEEESGKEVEAILFEITWPIRLAERKKELGLPEGTQVTILDLPGLKAVNDERNGPVIRANIAKAFCLVAYNAEETDRTKQKTLLNEVVNQVMALSYTPPCISLSEEDICVDSALQEDASQEPVSYGHVSSVQRMLFLLNRIDAFWRDKDPIASLNKFRSDITNQLHERLEKALPEHKEVIENIKLTQICSLPALLAVEADRLWEDPEKQTEILEKLEKFQQIFPEDYFDNLPRHFEQLTKGQRKDLITQALESSHSKEFEKYLSSYIATHLPEIVIGGPVNVVSRACGEFLGELRDLVTLYEEELKFGIMTSFYEQIRRKLIALSSYHSVEDFSHL